MADVGKGRMEGPYELAAVEQWPNFGITERHIVVQPGKRRPCDNYRASWVNRRTAVRHKVKLPEVDTTLDVVRAVWRAMGSAPPLVLWKRDHRDAYRQVPLRKEHRPYTTVVLRDPHDGRHKAFTHTVFPFGSVSSVTAYLRISMLLCHVARTVFGCVMQSYLDDFYVVEPEETAASSYEIFGELNRLVGVEIKEEKDQPPRGENTVLGVKVDVGTGGVVVCKLDEERRTRLMEAVAAALRDGFPQQAEGRKLAGRLSFACSVLQGRCGRGLVRTLIRESMGVGGQNREDVRAALRGMFRMLGTAAMTGAGRRVTWEEEKKGLGSPKHVVVYSDATGEGT
ncbi:hypothetical protein FOZ63_001643, partial [Perkinsus olseni]